LKQAQPSKSDFQVEEWMPILVEIIKQSLCIAAKSTGTNQQGLAKMIANLKNLVRRNTEISIICNASKLTSRKHF